MDMDGMRIALVAVTSNGIGISERLSREFRTDIFVSSRYAGSGKYQTFRHAGDIMESIFENYDAAIFVMSLGAVVRIIAPYLHDKFHDIPVLAIDDSARFVIPVTGGHHGANDMAGKISDILGACAVITTASDIHGIASVDSVAVKYGMAIRNRENLAPVSGDMLAGDPVQVINRTGIPVPDLPGSPSGRKIIITYMDEQDASALILVPHVLDLGIGFSSDATLTDMLNAIESTFKKFHLLMEAIRSISTIDIKSGNPDIKKLAENLECPLYFYPADELNRYASEKSAAVYRATGAYSVSNPAARISSGNGMQIVSKEIINNVTVSVFLHGH
ncbi:cobalamin biosynthesis protein [Ferroplasma sp.]|uniref:cobalt-precorrin 5A hydrolase n=1 Tax=Ferroplasma sp. TaxID=2591003 RepID=UPI002618D4F5|nr:cobalamin biosynthesis protein [Ferroplasma sp.]